MLTAAIGYFTQTIKAMTPQEDIQLVARQAKIPYDLARNLLKRTNGNIVDAIMMAEVNDYATKFFVNSDTVFDDWNYLKKLSQPLAANCSFLIKEWNDDIAAFIDVALRCTVVHQRDVDNINPDRISAVIIEQDLFNSLKDDVQFMARVISDDRYFYLFSRTTASDGVLTQMMEDALSKMPERLRMCFANSHGLTTSLEYRTRRAMEWIAEEIETLKNAVGGDAIQTLQSNVETLKREVAKLQDGVICRPTNYVFREELDLLIPRQSNKLLWLWTFALTVITAVLFAYRM